MEKIIQYFIQEKGVTEVVAKILSKTLSKYSDIKREFEYWIDNRDFNAPDAIAINGFTAKKINDIAPFLDAAGVYNFMVTLRDNPTKAQEYIKNGFPKK